MGTSSSEKEGNEVKERMSSNSTVDTGQSEISPKRGPTYKRKVANHTEGKKPKVNAPQIGRDTLFD